MKRFTQISFMLLVAGLSISLLSGCAKEGAESSSAAPTETTTTGTAATTQPAPLIPAVGWCNTDSLYVRKEPNPSAPDLGGLSWGEKVQILAKEGDWYKIEFKVTIDKVIYESGYVSAQYIQDTEPVPSAASTSSTASTTTTA